MSSQDFTDLARHAAPISSTLDRLDRILTDLDDRLRSTQRVVAARSVINRYSALKPQLRAMTNTVAAICRVPVCIVDVIDDEMVRPMAWASAEDTSVTACTVEQSYCQFVAGSGEAFEVSNSDTNILVRHHPATLATNAPIKSYFGAPIFSLGEPIGAFCIADHKPRQWTMQETSAVRAAAEQVTEIIAAHA